MTLLYNLLNPLRLLLFSWSGWAGFLVLLFLPGAWMAFGLRLRGLSFWPRLFTALMLSPLVVLAQFYLVRSLGASFEMAVPMLVFINLPAGYLIFRCPDGAIPSNWRIAMLAFFIVALAAGSLSPQ